MSKIFKKSFLSVVCLILLLILPMTVEAAGGSKKGSEKKEVGAAALLSIDSNDNTKEMSELVKNYNAKANDEKSLSKYESDLVMAKVNKYVNIRSEQDASSEKLGILYKDCGGHIIEKTEQWTKISSGNVVGWVNNDYLYFGDEALELAKDVGISIATSNTDALRVRKEPNTNAGTGVWGLLATGEALEAIEEMSDGWVSVDYEGQTGYVKRDYVTINFQIDEAESIEEIKAREAAEAEAKRNAMKEKVLASGDEMTILAALIQCEAGGEPYEGQIAVGAVVMNRVRSAAYPNSIKDVIYASGQFTPANSTKMSTLVLTGNIYQSCKQAAAEVVNGKCNVGDLTHFRRAGNKEGLIIGNHVFY